MASISVPSSVQTFTSSYRTDTTFRLDIQEDLSPYDQLEIDGELLDCDTDDMGDINNIITIKHISTANELPCTVYLPESTDRVQPAFQVYRGPLHPHEITLFNVKMNVYGVAGDTKKYIGSDVVQLEG